MPGYSIFWVPALSVESFEQACTEIVRELGIQNSSGNENAMEMVHRHLSSETGGQWLFIRDNADDMDLLFGGADVSSGVYKYLPMADNGVILLTSRSREVAVSFAQKNIIELQNMTVHEATELFENIVIKDLRSDEEATKKLLKELTSLPLAITQAAAYINSTKISTSRYLEMYGTENERIQLLSRHFPDATRYREMQDAVAFTWLISFENIKRHDPDAITLLEFISCIEPKGIPRSILPPLDSDE
ncbi:hypothetical protein BDV23DRAFT_178952 [Aspergillus alliaceus]|uniref:Uncharacterized protein n=1 Tax=Petromyces alliaceus TaxID=209559 RepID=A0A5N7CL52_PETAA|nr:hypothetical protein BDV23DRAFT_178952 [Aspergillus alliaceus]